MYSSPAASYHGSRPGTPQSLPPMSQPSPTQPQSNARWMQVKILYTFDDDSKTNCLARCPQPLQVQTATLDNATQIGIIELRTCVRAIVNASPEITAKLGRDFTVYAYDYSEYETPLVGQGMLSWVLASSSSTPNAPADQSKTMVTGKVTRNALGLFSSNGLQETLEVKLRLVPVPTSLQSEYLQGLEKYRDPSTVPTDNLDTAAWAAFLRDNPNFGMSPPADGGFQGAFDDHSVMSHLSPDMLSPGDDGQTPLDYNHIAQSAPPHFGSDAGSPYSQTFPSSAPPPRHNAPSRTQSRPHSPALSQSHKPRSQSHSQSRPDSRASHSRRPSLKTSQSCTSRVETTFSSADDGPPRKRARVEQVDWNSRSAFGQKRESLRVAASTAASIRGPRPSLSAHPTAAQIAAGELPDRPPTPRALPRIPQSFSRRASETAANSRPRFYQSPYSSLPNSDADQSNAGTPDRINESAVSSPQDMPSSPPVMSRASPGASSPQLPLPNDHADSGFFSGAVDDDCLDEDELRPLDDDDIQTASRYMGRRQATTFSELSFTEERPGDPSLLPRSSNQQPPKLAPVRKRKQSKTATPQPSSPALPPLPGPSHQDSFSLEDNDTGNELQSVADYLDINDVETSLSRESSNEQPTRQLGRQQSTMSEMTSRPGTPLGDGDQSQPTAIRRAQSQNEKNEKKKLLIQQRLEDAVRNGRMPAFCYNCGEISTPTWRKAFIKDEEGSPEHLGISDAEGEITALDVLCTDDTGHPTSYRIIKKSLRKDENRDECGYTEINLCNPCGIWLIKKREMRPKDKSQAAKDSQNPVRKRDRKAEYARRKAQKEAQQAALMSSTAMPESEAGNQSQPPSGRSDKSVAKSSGRSNKSKPKTVSGSRSAKTADQHPASDLGPLLDEMSAAAALERAFKSSPPRFPGSKHSPIKVEDDPAADNVKRLLFPSPKRSPPGKTPSPAKSPTSKSEANLPSPSQNFTDLNFDVFIAQDKENRQPSSIFDAHNDMDFGDFADLFTSPTGLRRSPRKSTSPYKHMSFGQSSPLASSHLLKTPTKRKALSPCSGNSSSKRRARDLIPLTPSRSAPLISEAHMTPFSKQLCQLLNQAGGSAGDMDVDAFDWNHQDLDELMKGHPLGSKDDAAEQEAAEEGQEWTASAVGVAGLFGA